MHSTITFAAYSDVGVIAHIHLAHPAALIDKLRFLQTPISVVPSAYDTWLARRRANTLQLPINAQSPHALAVARFVQHSPHTDDAICPGLATHPRNDLAYRSLSLHARPFVDRCVKERADDVPGYPYGDILSFPIRRTAVAAENQQC